MGGIGIGPDAGLGPEGGEGKGPGAPGSEGGDSGPASATVKSKSRKITASALPPDVRQEIEALVRDDLSVDIFVR